MRTLTKRVARAVPGAALLATLTACSTGGKVTGGDEQTKAALQSETAATTSYAGGVHRIIVAYNDETGETQKIQYPGQTQRKVLAGASQMGWSYSEDNGASWYYGGKVQPPQGWSVLWGDPAITTSNSHYNLVFLSNLAIPDSKFPAGGIDGPLTSSGDIRSSPLGGACIAKSTDGGKTFAIDQCVSNQDSIGDLPESTKGHFYDGGSMAAGPSGEIYSAHVDVATSQIDVWRAANESQPFQRLPPPFPGKLAVSHPRLRIGPDGSLYLAAEITVSYENYHVFMNRYSGGAWTAPQEITDSSAVYPDIDLNSTLQGSELKIRTGPQFSYDIGAASEGGGDAIRMLYTKPSGLRFYVAGVACRADMTDCGTLANWGTSPSGPNEQPLDAFNPDVVAWRGFFNFPPTWQGTFVTRYGRSVTTVNVTRETLGYVNGQPFTIPVDIIKNAPVCSDTRGYWGDYDAMLLIGFRDTNGIYMRFLTDSSAGCSKRWGFVGVAQHIQAVQYDY